ncbi:MAG TPA: phytanoyl-CoA dioxygenase family protein [Solirubrobacteraceae bacterium]|nr:phytanoyl-CoA dioxygenase family protein [Solirubrobacteraceae bacterium]
MSAAHGFALGDGVTAGQRAWYEQFGFIVFRGVLSPEEVETIRGEAEALERRTLAGELPPSDVDDLTPPSRDEAGNARLHRLPYFTRYCPGAREIVHQPRIASLARLVADDAWMLEDTLHGAIWQLKRGGKGSRYSEIRWHIDFEDDHVLSPVVSAGIYLDESTVRNGCLAVVPMSHRYPPRKLPPVPLLVEARPGDVVCHAHNVYHGSGPVLAGAPSRATLYLYFCGGEYPGPDLPFAPPEHRSRVRRLFVGAGERGTA